jgi:hypothetical protein
MPNPARDKPRLTTPEEKGVELHPDAWERFERTFDKVVKAPPTRDLILMRSKVKSLHQPAQ